MTVSLPDPLWTDHPQRCFKCSYALGGLMSPGLCPECGTRFDTLVEGEDVLMLAGVPRTSSTSPGRSALWALLFVAGTVYVQFLMVFIMALGHYNWLIVVGLVAWTVAMLKSSKRERRGRENFILSSGGIARVAMDAHDRSDAVFVPWESVTRYELRRVSMFWRRLRMWGRSSVRPGEAVVFDAGFRCPDADAPMVTEAVEFFLNSARSGPKTMSW